MRILFLNSIYEAYWRQFYLERVYLDGESYQQQFDEISADFFSFYGSYPYYLRRYGYECVEFYFSVTPQQRVWSQEQGLAFDEKTFRYQNPLEMVRRFKPEIVFIISSEHGLEWMQEARRACPSIRLFARWCSTRVPMESLSGYDLILTSARSFEREMRSSGLNVRRLPFAFDPRVLESLGETGARTIPLSFVGGLNFAAGFHLERMRIIHRLQDEGIMDAFVSVRLPSKKYETYLSVMRKALAQVRRTGLSDRTVFSLPMIGRHLEAGGRVDVAMLKEIASRSRGPRYGLEMYRVLAASYATFNAHIDAVGDCVGNIRMFEATGLGCCMLTDWKSDLGDFFEVDREVVAYRSVAEATEKARWLAANQRVSGEIGKAAQKRILRDHTYAHRAELMHGYFCEQLEIKGVS
ncbi:MAG: glycosyltransferase family protein [Candidatus Geothermincolia bacterium]